MREDNSEKRTIFTYDLALFMGQSNMAGRGDAAQAPKVPQGMGYEFRSISGPTKLYPVTEPFGANENNAEGISEPGMKSGSLVSAFMLSYYRQTKIPVVGLSASIGGSSINEWQPQGAYLNDAVDRLQGAQAFFNSKRQNVRHTFMVWCQGETDGDHHMPADEYTIKLQTMVEVMLRFGVEYCFVIQIGNHRDNPRQYLPIQQAQADFCDRFERAVLVSTHFKSMLQAGLMKDMYHYKQAAYNMVGEDAGKNAANFLKTHKKLI